MDILSIVLQFVLGFVFLLAGVTKVFGSKMHRESFEHWRLPQWFRVVTGLVEVIGAVAMFVGIWTISWAVFAGAWLAIIMFVGIFVHIRVKDTFQQILPAIILFLSSAAVYFINY